MTTLNMSFFYVSIFFSHLVNRVDRHKIFFSISLLDRVKNMSASKKNIM